MFSKKIVLVEDNLADSELVRIAVEELGFVNEIVSLNNSEDIYNYFDSELLNKIGIVLLDLNMPRVNGMQILEYIRNSTRLKHLPVVVFTTSSNKNDITACYNLRANAYMYKPIDYDTFNDTIKATLRFWLDTNITAKVE